MAKIFHRVSILFGARFPDIELTADHICKIDKWITKLRKEEEKVAVPPPQAVDLAVVSRITPVKKPPHPPSPKKPFVVKVVRVPPRPKVATEVEVQPPPPPPVAEVAVEVATEVEKFTLGSAGWVAKANLTTNTQRAFVKSLRKFLDAKSGSVFDWANLSESNGLKRTRASQLCLWAPFTLEITDEDLKSITKLKDKMQKLKKNNVKESIPNPKIGEKFEKVIALREKIASGEVKVTAESIFGVCLPARRPADASLVKIFDSAESELTAFPDEEARNEHNAYHKDTHTFVFRKYKTSAGMGVQTFCLDDENVAQFCVSVPLVVAFLDGFADGATLFDYVPRTGTTYQQRDGAIGKRVGRALKVSTRDMRHYWATEARKGSRERQLLLATLLAHGVESQVVIYAEDLGESGDDDASVKSDGSE